MRERPKTKQEDITRITVGKKPAHYSGSLLPLWWRARGGKKECQKARTEARNVEVIE
jgi:hypothetical protein